MRASDLLGRTAYGPSGERIGRVVDLVAEDGVLTAAVVTRGPWGRLLGYDREQVTGPAVVEHLARWILRRDTRVVPFDDLDLRGS